MKKSKLLSILVIVFMLMQTVLCNVYASNAVNGNLLTNLTENQLNKLNDAGVAQEDILSLCEQIEVYNLTDLQVENYINGLIENQENESINELSENQEPVEYEKTENGDIITPYGIVPKQDISLKWIEHPSTRSVSSLSTRTVSSDQTGVYYLVKSIGGHNQLTSYVTLPKTENVNEIDRPYHMFGMYSTNGSNTMYGDIGLVYFPSSKQWKGFYNVVENNSPSSNYEFSFTGGKEIYFHLQMYTNKAVLIIRDAASWAEVGRITYTFRTNCIPSNFSTTRLAKQITYCETKLSEKPKKRRLPLSSFKTFILNLIDKLRRQQPEASNQVILTF